MVGETYSWGAGGADVYLVRVDSNGNRLWNKTFGSGANDCGKALVALDDGFAIIGYTDSYGPSTDSWLIRTNLDGDHMFDSTIGGTLDDYGLDIVACSGGGFTIVGYTYSYGEGGSDVWLVHTDNLGNHQWNETYGRPSTDIGYSVIEHSGGGYVFCGYTIYSADTHAWLIRTDASGAHQWNKTFSGTESDWALDVIECGSGGFAIAGETLSYGVDGSAPWLIRTDASGNHLWNQTYDEPSYESAEAIIEYSNGDFALAGYRSHPIPPPKESSSRALIYGDGLLIYTDSSGTMLWEREFGGLHDDRYYGIVKCSNGALVTAGYARSYSLGSNEDGWVVKTPYPLVWDPEPTDQTLVYGASLSYDLNVSSYFGVDTWTVNDTSRFVITGAGVVSNAPALEPGVLGLRVTVNDSVGIEITGEFTVTVGASTTTPAPIPLELIVGIAAVIIVLVLILLYYFVLRKRK